MAERTPRNPQQPRAWPALGPAENASDDPHELRVAHATGTGCGKFLAAAMRDAMPGSDVAFVQPSADGIEFVFRAPGSGEHEIIRVELDDDGRVLRVDMLRAWRPQTQRRYLLTESLLHALAKKREIRRLQWRRDENSLGDLTFAFEDTTLRVPVHDSRPPAAM